MAEHYIFSIYQLSKAYGKKEVLKNINLSFYPGAKIGVLGSNGSGKSTLLRVMALEDKDFLGQVRPHEGISIGYVPQEPPLDETKTVLEIVEEAVAPTRNLLKLHEDLGTQLGEPDVDFDKVMARMDDVTAKIELVNAWELDRQLEMAMDAMRLPPSDAKVATLSGGEKRRVFMCKTLLQKPDLLLLDEPTNHLDAESVDWLERHLKDYEGTVVAVTHDRYFLDNVAEYILELDRGVGHPFKGNYSSWLEQKRARLEVEEKTQTARKKLLDKEIEWSRMAPRARMAKSKARLSAIETMQNQDYDEQQEELVIQIPNGPELGDLVVRAEGLKKGYGDRVLMDDLSFNLPKGGIVGVIGAKRRR